MKWLVTIGVTAMMSACATSTPVGGLTREQVYQELVVSKQPKVLPAGAVTDPFSPAYGFVSTKTRQQVIDEMHQ